MRRRDSRLFSPPIRAWKIANAALSQLTVDGHGSRCNRSLGEAVSTPERTAVVDQHSALISDPQVVSRSAHGEVAARLTPRRRGVVRCRLGVTHAAHGGSVDALPAVQAEAHFDDFLSCACAEPCCRPLVVSTAGGDCDVGSARSGSKPTRPRGPRPPFEAPSRLSCRHRDARTEQWPLDSASARGCQRLPRARPCPVLRRMTCYCSGDGISYQPQETLTEE